MIASRAGLLSALMLAAPLLAGTTAQAAQFVTNGNFATTVVNGTTYTNDSGPSFNMQGQGSVTGWNDNGGYNMLYTNAASATSSSNGVSGAVWLWATGNGGISTFSNPTTGGPAFIAMDSDFPGNTAAVSQNITGLAVGKSYVLTFEYGFAQQAGFDNSPNTLYDLLAANLSSGGILTTTSGASCLESDGAGSGGYNFPDKSFTGWINASCTFTATASNEVLSFLSSSTLAVPPFAVIANVSLTGPAIPEPMSIALFGAGLAGLAGARRLRRSA